MRGSVTPQPIQQVLECVVVVLQQGVHVVLAKLSTGTNEKEVSQVQEGARVPGGLPIREDDTGDGVVLRIETEKQETGAEIGCLLAIFVGAVRCEIERWWRFMMNGTLPRWWFCREIDWMTIRLWGFAVNVRWLSILTFAPQ